jgi:hypothetical protein
MAIKARAVPLLFKRSYGCLPWKCTTVSSVEKSESRAHFANGRLAPLTTDLTDLSAGNGKSAGTGQPSEVIKDAHLCGVKHFHALGGTLSRLVGFCRDEFEFFEAEKQRFDLSLLVGRWQAGSHGGRHCLMPPAPQK